MVRLKSRISENACKPESRELQKQFNRYLLMEIKFEDGLLDESLTSSMVASEIMCSVQNTHGDYGVACLKASFRVKYLNPYTGVIKIKCSRDYYRMLWQAITFVKKINERPCLFTTLHLAGTINSCQRFLVKHNKQQLLNMLAQSKTPAEKEKLSKVLEKLPTMESGLSASQVRKRKQKQLAWKHFSG